MIDRSVSAGLSIYGVLAVLGFLGSEVNPFDESLQLLGGLAVARGRVPHRDLWSMYPPLNYYLDGLAFRLFGPSFMVARLISACLYTLTVIVAVRYVVRRLSAESPVVRWLTATLVVFCLTRTLQLSQNNTIFAAVLVLLFSLTSINRDGRLSSRALIASGVFCGLILMMRLNLGLYLTASLGATVLFATELHAPLRQRLRLVASFSIPTLLTLVAFLAPFGSSALDLLRQTALSPNLILRAGHASDVSRQPAPYCCLFALTGFALLSCRVNWRSGSELRTALGLSAGSFSVASLTLLALSTRGLLLVPYIVPGLLIGVLITVQVVWERFEAGVFLALCFLVASLQYYLIRGDGLHLFILAGAVSLVVATAVATQPGLVRVSALGALFWIMMQFPLPVGHIGLAQWLWPVNPKAVVPAIRVMLSSDSFLALGDAARLTNGFPLRDFETRFYPEENELATVRYVNEHAPPGDAVFMGLTSHDRTRVNDARLSWMLPRPLASRYWELEPGIITSSSVQDEVVKSLTEVRWLVLQDTIITGTAMYAFERSRLLDQFIAAGYRRARTFGNLHVYCRRDACPSETS